MPIGTSPPAPLQDGERGNKSEKEIPLRSKVASGVIAHQYVDDYKKNQAVNLEETVHLPNNSYGRDYVIDRLMDLNSGGNRS